MENILSKTLSPTAAKVYAVLLKCIDASAKEIGRKIKIAPSNTYRDLRELMRLGLVLEIHSYPIHYQAKPALEAISLYQAAFQENFRELFGLKRQNGDGIKITFFQSRKELIKMTEKENAQAKKCINCIISGHEIPAETFLSNKKALDRGVKIRRLIQEPDNERKTMAKNWRKMGVETKSVPNMGIRVVTYDGRITYFSSYDPKRQPDAIGVRFDYVPYAALMDELFEQKWQQGKII